MPIEQKELIALKGQVSKLENQANQVTITTPEENALATNLKAKLKETGQTIKARKEEITKPLNAALKSARDLFAPIEAQFEAAENIVGRKLLVYKQKIDADNRAKEKAIADKIEADRIKLEEEVAAGKISEEQAARKLEVKMEKAEEKVDNLEQVNKTTSTMHGKVTFRITRKVRIINQSLVPAEYLVVDMVAVRRDALAGKQIAGVEVYEEESV
jgi:hypothetical protein